jgi:hypothetical protein
MIRRILLAALGMNLLAFSLQAQEPDYSAWNAILQKHYHPARGMDYAALKKQDLSGLQALRARLGRVNVDVLNRKQQLAYWINTYNVNVVATVVENYPVKSIRDISTDPIVRLNVFKKPRVPFGTAMLSLDDVENEKIRNSFRDPRIHFAINCAARSCPPIRMEAYSGEKVDAQLDDQTRKFLSGAVRFSRWDDTLVIHLPKIMDWFEKDFGDKVAFLRKYLPVPAAGKVGFQYDSYDWSLNNR